jgi:hypothetical protein
MTEEDWNTKHTKFTPGDKVKTKDLKIRTVLYQSRNKVYVKEEYIGFYDPRDLTKYDI